GWRGRGGGRRGKSGRRGRVRMPRRERSGRVARHCAERRSAVSGLGQIEQHERPADGAELLVDAGARAAAAAAPIHGSRSLTLAPLALPAVEDHLDALVAGGGALCLLLELAAVARPHEEGLGGGPLFLRRLPGGQASPPPPPGARTRSR